MAVQSMLELLPYIVRLFPAVRTLPIVKGLAIPINDVHGITDPELARNLARKTSIKKNKTFTLILTLPAIIAAVSSLLNGREARRVKKELQETKIALHTINGKIES